MKTWLEARGLAEFLPAFEKHRIDFEVLGDLILTLTLTLTLALTLALTLTLTLTPTLT